MVGVIEGEIIVKNDQRGNKNYFEVAGGSSYQESTVFLNYFL